MNLPSSHTHSSQALDEFELEETSFVSLPEALTWIGESKRFVLLSTVGCGIAAALLSFALPVTFTASTSFLPPANTQQQSGSAAALAALGSLGGLGGMSAKTPDEMYVALLGSDSVLRGLDGRFKLRERYGAANHEALRRAMSGIVRIGADKKSGLITVDVDDKDPAFAAELANAHADEVSKVMGRLAIGEAQQRRVFYEKQLKETKEALIQAETAMRAVQEKSGVVALEKQAEVAVGGVAQLRQMIAEREVRMRVLRVDTTAQNPAVLKLASELEALRSELVRSESFSGSGGKGETDSASLAKLPAAAIDFVRARRELKLQEALMEGLIRQYEMAKLDEAKESPSLQQVDVAIRPEHKSKPKRAALVLAAAAMGLTAAMLLVLLRRYREKLSIEQPERAAQWGQALQAWKWGRR